MGCFKEGVKEEGKCRLLIAERSLPVPRAFMN